MEDFIRVIVLFFAAALFEIYGGYAIWRWLKEKKSWIFGLLGGLTLFAYGVIPTLQPAHFGRVYAAYGGIFILSSIIWGAIVDRDTPDRYEVIGALIAFLGALIIFFAPR